MELNQFLLLQESKYFRQLAHVTPVESSRSEPGETGVQAPTHKAQAITFH